MKKFGFRKDKDGGSKSPAPSNPYAQQSDPDPYTTGAPPPPYASSNNSSVDRVRQEKSPVPPGGYGGGQQDRYGAGSANYGGYGAGGGASRYGASQAEAAGSRYGNSGYGGFGRAPGQGALDGQTSGNPTPPPVGRYGGGPAPPPGQQQPAPQSLGAGGAGRYAGGAGRYGGQSAVQQDITGSASPAPGQDGGGTDGSAYGSNAGYGAYADRQLTAEEQEEEDILAAKQEIRFVKQQDVSSTRNALRIAAQAEETGRATLERLGAQGERIHNTERNLDLASNQNRLAAEKAREIKTLNRSMFAVHVSNPFTSSKRTAEREQTVLEQARKDREMRDATRAAAWSTAARQQDLSREAGRVPAAARTKASLADRAKYQFEADSEDEAMEDEIDSNLHQLHGAVRGLNGLAKAMGQEVESQNRHIERIGGKVDRVDDEIALNKSRLDRIH
ncbi:hypothetical protein EJ06DRAFT_578471 [Trichodelitschia bisporula]|uniref:t-SNARE coiled-coil homology domain-containing protein n=1 Tax=Trichodelitschia bisporula TaxID=703511 RepID=A0A6G1IAD1_9PEZI|nr:hypothetical protein EJ06DRAFT_578471 [Trichodelitschia bisporula]